MYPRLWHSRLYFSSSPITIDPEMQNGDPMLEDFIVVERDDRNQGIIIRDIPSQGQEKVLAFFDQKVLVSESGSEK